MLNLLKKFSFRLFVTLLFSVISCATLQAEQQFPDVVAVSVSSQGQQGQKYRFDVTLSSPYDSAKRYADAFRVMSLQGEVFGVRQLLHDHANEQPFTRSLSNVLIPKHIHKVIIQGRDQTYGWGGSTQTVTLPK